MKTLALSALSGIIIQRQKFARMLHSLHDKLGSTQQVCKVSLLENVQTCNNSSVLV